MVQAECWIHTPMFFLAEIFLKMCSPHRIQIVENAPKKEANPFFFGK